MPIAGSKSLKRRTPYGRHRSLDNPWPRLGRSARGFHHSEPGSMLLLMFRPGHLKALLLEFALQFSCRSAGNISLPLPVKSRLITAMPRPARAVGMRSSFTSPRCDRRKPTRRCARARSRIEIGGKFIADDEQPAILPSGPYSPVRGAGSGELNRWKKAETKRRRPALHVFDSSPILTTTIPNSRASALLGAMALSKWKSTRKELPPSKLDGTSRM